MEFSSYCACLGQLIVIMFFTGPLRKLMVGTLLVILSCGVLSELLRILSLNAEDQSLFWSQLLHTLLTLTDTAATKLNGFLNVLRHGIGQLIFPK
ncbi:putative protein U2 [Almpiwar virus]|uniref:Uncharacterized protein n=1 Tax=Almpiwar virus TaxID=318843 RepID=A0A024A0M6_9RHAB|nr:putative protein U2 [Almpiwar virus]AHY85666.1 putative protein U2 [Almpiwar virus]